MSATSAAGASFSDALAALRAVEVNRWTAQTVQSHGLRKRASFFQHTLAVADARGVTDQLAAAEVRESSHRRARINKKMALLQAREEEKQRRQSEKARGAKGAPAGAVRYPAAAVQDSDRVDETRVFADPSNDTLMRTHDRASRTNRKMAAQAVAALEQPPATAAPSNDDLLAVHEAAMAMNLLMSEDAITALERNARQDDPVAAGINAAIDNQLVAIESVEREIVASGADGTNTSKPGFFRSLVTKVFGSGSTGPATQSPSAPTPSSVEQRQEQQRQQYSAMLEAHDRASFSQATASTAMIERLEMGPPGQGPYQAPGQGLHQAPQVSRGATFTSSTANTGQRGRNVYAFRPDTHASSSTPDWSVSEGGTAELTTSPGAPLAAGAQVPFPLGPASTSLTKSSGERNTAVRLWVVLVCLWR